SFESPDHRIHFKLLIELQLVFVGSRSGNCCRVTVPRRRTDLLARFLLVLTTFWAVTTTSLVWHVLQKSISRSVRGGFVVGVNIALASAYCPSRSILMNCSLALLSTLPIRLLPPYHVPQFSQKGCFARCEAVAAATPTIIRNSM